MAYYNLLDFIAVHCKTFVFENKLEFDYTDFDKTTVKYFLDFCYGIPECLDNLDVAATMELIRFLRLGPVYV